MLLTSLLLGCAVCGAAQPVLPANGVEPAFEGRRRATVDIRAAEFRTREASPREVSEQRVEPGVAFAVGASTLIGAALPLVRRSTSASAGEGGSAPARHEELMLGDLDLRASTTASRGVGRHLAFDVGVKLPTAKGARDARGVLLPADLQPGCSSIAPFVGVTARWARPRLAFWATGALLLPFAVREDVPHPGDSLRAAVNVQVEPWRGLALRIALTGRADAAASFRETLVQESGGAQAYVAPELVLAPVGDVVITVGAAVPAFQAMRAYRTTMPVALLSVGTDL